MMKISSVETAEIKFFPSSVSMEEVIQNYEIATIAIKKAEQKGKCAIEIFDFNQVEIISPVIVTAGSVEVNLKQRKLLNQLEFGSFLNANRAVFYSS